ncbi:hypothetical protein CB1_001103012 [Camelus ferus]|nr:hypothetical protein CB1_001103012 [Camelus ferus]
MRGNFGKPQDTAASVHVGQVITSIHAKIRKKCSTIEQPAHVHLKDPGTAVKSSGAAGKRGAKSKPQCTAPPCHARLPQAAFPSCS